jgi:hypothetical protein
LSPVALTPTIVRMRALDNGVPVWLLAPGFVLGAALIAVVGFKLARLSGVYSPGTGADTMVSAFSSRTTTLFGILLVFVIVSEFSHLNEAQSTAQHEATALAQIVRDAQAFPPPVAARIRASVAAYGNSVVHDEWKSLRNRGATDPTTVARLADLQQTIQAYQPKGANAITWYGKTADNLEATVQARRDRVQSAQHAIPDALLWLLFGGAIVFVLTMYGFSKCEERLLVVMIVLLAALTGAGLFMTVVLDYPFSGSIAVSSAPYHEGILSQLIRP